MSHPAMPGLNGGPVRIGALVPLTRPGWAEAGRQLLAGLELGVRDVNDAGGIDGRPLELVVRDTAADPARAAAAVDECDRLGVAALAGEYHSVVARAAAERADAVGLPFLCSSAVLDALTDRPTSWVARLAPQQSHGWHVYADFLRRNGHRRIAVAAQPSLYWASGIRLLRERLDVLELDPASVVDGLVASGATALLLLTGHPEPALSIADAVRRDPRLAGILVGAPAGQPEFAEWAGARGTGIPFLRYRPERLTALGVRVEAALGGRPSFVAFEGYDTIAVLGAVMRAEGTRAEETRAEETRAEETRAEETRAEGIRAEGTRAEGIRAEGIRAEGIRAEGADRERIAAAWPHVAVDGTRGRIRFSRTPGTGVWQWARPPVQVVDRDPADPLRFRVLHAA